MRRVAPAFAAMLMLSSLASVSSLTSDALGQSAPTAPADGVPPDGAVAAVDPRAEAARKFKEGSKAFSEKRYKDAVDLFLEADAFVHNADLAYNTSLAYDAMGDTSNALRWAREYLRRAPAAEDRADVEKQAAALEARLQEKGVQQVTVISKPVGATVLVDDAAVGVTPWTGDLRPGHHRLELRQEGRRKVQQSFELAADRALDVEVEMQVEEPATLVKPSTERPAWAATMIPVGAAVLGAGALGFGVALGLEVRRSSAEADAADADLQVDAAEHVRRAEDFQLGARIAVGLGAGLAVAGGTMLVLGLVTEGPPPPRAPEVSAGCSDDGCSFALRGQFF